MIADLRPYPEYKDSGLPWLGRVPGHWEVRRTKAILREVDRRSTTGSEPLLSLRMQSGLVDHHALGGKLIPPSVLVGYKRVLPGEIVMNRMRAAAGLFAAATSDGLVSPDYAIFRPACQMSVAYAVQLFRTPAMTSLFRLESRGLGTGESGFLRLYSDRFGMLPVPFPSPAEQAAIVRFLGWANGRLERAIRAKRKVIALLNEQKQAIIHRAVTRGLDPTIPLKPSGVPWLGDIPQKWKACSLKLLVQVKDGTHDTPMYREPGVNTYPLVTSRHIVGGTIQVDSANHIAQEDFEAISRRSNVALGDVIMPMIGTIGNPVVVRITTPFAIKNVALFKTSTSKELLPAFLVYLLESPFIQRQFDDLSRGGVQGFVSLGVLRNLLVPKLDREEQAAIVRLLDTELATTNTAISSLEREIELLREYRTRLVADVVTGKLDVREAAALLPDEPAPDITEDDTDLTDDPEAADEEAVA